MKFSDKQIQEWAERHDMTCVRSFGELRLMVEDAATMEPEPGPITKPNCDECDLPEKLKGYAMQCEGCALRKETPGGCLR
jgi:hypothetical protein